MTNFEKQLNQAIITYSELSGMSVDDIKSECVDFDSYTSEMVKMIMFAAR